MATLVCIETFFRIADRKDFPVGKNVRIATFFLIRKFGTWGLAVPFIVSQHNERRGCREVCLTVR